MLLTLFIFTNLIFYSSGVSELISHVHFFIAPVEIRMDLIYKLSVHKD